MSSIVNVVHFFTTIGMCYFANRISRFAPLHVFWTYCQDTTDLSIVDSHQCRFEFTLPVNQNDRIVFTAESNIGPCTSS